jgi:hypothetical protein
MVPGILCLTMTLSAAAQNNQSVPNAPFVVQPASFFQPFQATAPFYINSQYHPNPPFVPNPPYNPTPNYSEQQQQPAVVPEIAVPQTRPLEAPPVEEQLSTPQQESEQPAVEPQVIREKPTPAPAAPSAVLALRNGALLETQSYAIAGGTVLISSGTESRRIKVSELDIAKTQMLNRQRGIQFALPR